MERLTQRSLGILVLIVCVWGCGGCASTMHSGPWPVNITAVPTVSNVTITNLRTGLSILSATTPFVASLERGAGYFVSAQYQITIAKPGYHPQAFVIEGRLDGWYFGNLFVGGLAGFLIIDPLTGSMYTLPSHIHAVLAKSETPSDGSPPNAGLTFHMPTQLSALPDTVRAALQPVALIPGGDTPETWLRDTQ